MIPEVIAAVAAGIVTVLGAFFGFTKWILNTFLKELKPNGGSSLKDQVTRLEVKYDDLDKKVDKLYDLIITHLGRK
jgi:phage major head subunit gpT-like protein